MIRYVVCLAAAGCLTGLASESPLADAVEKGDQGKSSELLAAGSDVNSSQIDGMTALHWAVHRDDTATTRLLVEAGASVTAPNRYGVTPLALACQNGNAEIVRLLLENGADPDSTLNGGETALMTASRTGRADCVKALLARGAKVNAKESKGQTAVMWAAAEGHADVVGLLIDGGADFRTPLASGFTPLLFAARSGRAEVVRVLIKAGADVRAIAGPENGKPRKGVTCTAPLLMAIENGHFELALELVAAGADLNDQRSGFTPLHNLTWVRKTGIGEEADGQPPPAGSGRITSLDFIRTLVKRGADVNARLTDSSGAQGHVNAKGATPLLFAAESADLPMIRLLVELGADSLLPNDEGCTPLMAAAGMGTFATEEEAGTEPEAIETVKFLLEKGADVNTVDRKGETAMHGAAYKSFPQMVRLLAANGADINLWNRKNQHGWTPLLIARGYRLGNYRPAPATAQALIEAMQAKGVEIPPDPGPR